MNLKRKAIVRSVLPMALFLSLCFPGQSEPAGGELVKINARLGWQVNANSAGQIAALEKGFYKEVGLDVKLYPGGLVDPSVRTVAAGVDQVGFANGPDLVLKARDSGVPLKILAIVQQESYHGFFVKADSPISSPKDWEGHRVGVKYASPTFLLYQVLIRKLGVDRSKIEEIPLKFGVHPFIEGDIDMYPGAKTNEAISLEQMGIKLRVTSPSEYDIDTYGNVIFSTDSMIAENPDVLRKFVRATFRGWEWCLRPENEEQTIGFMQKHSPHLDPAKESRALRENRRLVGVEDIGKIDTSKLAGIIQYMKDFELLREDMAVADVVAEGFAP